MSLFNSTQLAQSHSLSYSSGIFFFLFVTNPFEINFFVLFSPLASPHRFYCDWQNQQIIIELGLHSIHHQKYTSIPEIHMNTNNLQHKKKDLCAFLVFAYFLFLCGIISFTLHMLFGRASFRFFLSAKLNRLESPAVNVQIVKPARRQTFGRQASKGKRHTLHAKYYFGCIGFARGGPQRGAWARISMYSTTNAMRVMTMDKMDGIYTT